MMQALDEEVGALMQKLKEKKLLDNTIVLFISDNGANKKGSNYPLRGYKGGFFEGGHRVPGILFWQGKTIAGSSDITITTADILPTMAELLGQKHFEQPIDGLSVLSLIEGKHLDHKNSYWQAGSQAAIRSGDWKYLEQDNHRYLFNLKNDIGKKTTCLMNSRRKQKN